MRVAGTASITASVVRDITDRTKPPFFSFAASDNRPVHELEKDDFGGLMGARRWRNIFQHPIEWVALTMQQYQSCNTRTTV